MSMMDIIREQVNLRTDDVHPQNIEHRSPESLRPRGFLRLVLARACCVGEPLAHYVGNSCRA